MGYPRWYPRSYTVPRFFFFKSVLPIIRHGRISLTVELTERGTLQVKQLLRVSSLKANKLPGFLSTTLSDTPNHRSLVVEGTQRECMAAKTNVQAWFWATTNHKGYHSIPSTRYSLVLGREVCAPPLHSTLPTELSSFTPYFYMIHHKRKFPANEL